jgi:hypothetical protein
LTKFAPVVEAGISVNSCFPVFFPQEKMINGISSQKAMAFFE